jgi:beta-lactam-binding protein with PASTA domain
VRRSAATLLAAAALAGCGTSGSAGPEGNDRPPATVPNVVGQQLSRANEVLAHAGFSVRATIVRGRRPRNAVLTQDPRPGADSHRAATVRVTVSDGVAG